MVQCVSSSEQDMAEAREISWRAPRTDFSSETDAQSIYTYIYYLSFILNSILNFQCNL